MLTPMPLVLCASHFVAHSQAFGAAMGIDNKIISAAAQHFFFCYLEFGLAIKQTTSAGGHFMLHIVPIARQACYGLKKDWHKVPRARARILLPITYLYLNLDLGLILNLTCIPFLKLFVA